VVIIVYKMKIGIVGNGFVGRATQIFAKNYFTQDPNAEIFEVLPDTVTTRAKPNSVMTYSAEAQDAAPPHHTAAQEAEESNVVATLCCDASLASFGEGRTRSHRSAFAEQYTAVGGRNPPPFFKRTLFKPIQLYIYDIRPEACQPPGITLEELDRECDLLFFCLPTPLHHDGSCYTRILEDTIARCSNPYKVIRSTVPVGFAAKHGCYFMPEFLTEANWEDDFRRMKEWVVGIPAAAVATTADEFKIRIQKLIKRSHKNRAIDSPTVVFCDTNEAEMLKLMKNCFLSAKVGIMNEFYDFCAATGTDYNRVTELAKRDARMGTSHFQVPGPDGRRGFGGTCFPKDTHSLYCQMNAHGITPHIYPAILARNDTVDRPEREWSRDVWRTTIPLPTPESKVVVVFSDTGVSEYLTDVIRTNLAKNNVVIQVVRAAGSASQPIHKNLLVKHRPGPNAPLFFPRVDECYYTQHTGDTLYDIMREVSNVIDLWDSHEEMKLYVVKQSRYDDESGTESGTEGFDSDGDDDDTDAKSRSRDYAGAILEEYFTKVLSVMPKQKRGLVVLF
jgi:UDPglucose 6-dehydrogenase